MQLQKEYETENKKDSTTSTMSGVDGVLVIDEEIMRQGVLEPDVYMKTIYRLILDNNSDEKSLDRVALVYFGNRITYRELFEQIDKVARSFVASGVKAGDIVAVCMPNTPEGLYSFYALNKIGAVASMIHPLSSESAIKEYLNKTEAKLLVTVDAAFEKIVAIKNQTYLEKIVVVSPSNSMKGAIKVAYSIITEAKEKLKVSGITSLKSRICEKFGIDKEKFHVFPDHLRGKLVKFRKEIDHVALTHKIEYDNDCMRWNSFLETGIEVNGDIEAPFEEGKLAALFNTGGTTGGAKMVMHSNDTFNAATVAMYNSSSQFKAGDDLYSIFPIFHGVGLSSGPHLTLYGGMRFHLVPKPSPKGAVKDILASKANHLAGVPTLWIPVFQEFNRMGVDLSHVKTVFSGADAISEEAETEINSILSLHHSTATVTNGIGLTETVAAHSCPDDNHRGVGTMGVPLQGVTLKITRLANRILLDGDEEIYGTSESVENNQSGEMCVSGPGIMLGYYKDKEATDAVLKIHDDGMRYLHTGDVGRIDENGLLRFVGRIKRMFVSNGHNIYPSEIERVIETHLAVSKAIVGAVPSEKKGMSPIVAVVLNTGYSINSELIDSLKGLCERELHAWMQPISFSFYMSYADVPKTLYNKTSLDVNELRANAIVSQDFDEVPDIEKILLPIR